MPRACSVEAKFLSFRYDFKRMLAERSLRLGQGIGAHGLA